MTPNPLDEIQARADAATDGPWVIRDISDHIYSPADDTGWWWVWQESKLPYYGGVFDPNERTDNGVPDGAVGQCAIDDNETGVQEKADAVFIAHAREDVPKLVAALRAVVEVLNDFPPPPKSADPNGEILMWMEALAEDAKHNIREALG